MSTPFSHSRSPSASTTASADSLVAPAHLPTPSASPDAPFQFHSSRFSAETLATKPSKVREWFANAHPPPLPKVSFGHSPSASEGAVRFPLAARRGSTSSDNMSPLSTAAVSGIARNGWCARAGEGTGEEVLRSEVGRMRRGWGGVIKELGASMRGHVRNKSSGSSQSIRSEFGNLHLSHNPPRQHRLRSISSQPQVALDKTKWVTPAPPSTAYSPDRRLRACQLPPRSDSRPQQQYYRKFTSPRRGILDSPRPTAPPATAALLNLPLPAVPASPAPAPFRALLVRAPRPASIRGRSDEQVLVSLNAGGVVLVTNVETLRGAGRLHEFVEAAVAQTRAQLNKPHQTRQDSGASVYPHSEGSSSDGTSFSSPSAFTASPIPFPIEFAAFDRNPTATNNPILSPQETLLTPLPGSPDSPVDPFAQRLWQPCPPSAAPKGCTRHLRSGSAGQCELVPSPPARMRIRSIRPEMCTSESEPDSNDEPACSSDAGSFQRGQPLPLSGEIDLDEFSPFERALGPFFKVLAEQTTIQGGAGKAESLAVVLPVDVSAVGTSSLFCLPLPVEDNFFTEGVALALPLRRPLPPKLTLRVPPARDRHHAQASLSPSAASRPPSLSTILNSDENDLATTPTQLRVAQQTRFDEAETEHPIYEVFLDRSPAPYDALLTYLRTATLPPAYAIPHFVPASASAISKASSSSNPLVTAPYLELALTQPSLLAERFDRLRALGREAAWLGMDELGGAVKAEMRRVGEVVAWVLLERKREGREGERRPAKEAKGKKVKEGWI